MVVQVSAKVAEGYNAVRDLRCCNMFDANAACQVGISLGYDDFVSWVREKQEEYQHAVRHGLEVLPIVKITPIVEDRIKIAEGG